LSWPRRAGKLRICMRVSVFGLGYVGAVTAGCLAKRGHRVIGVDVNPRKVELLGRGEAPILEPSLGEMLREARAKGLLSATCSCAHAVAATDTVIICVGTPALESGDLDLSSVRQVLGDISTALRVQRRAQAVVLRSTVLPGSTARLVEEFLADLECNGLVKIFYHPEFTREGTAVADFEAPSLTVVGTRQGRPVPPDMIEELFGVGAAVVDWETAELVKHACNAFHATKVAFGNEMGRVAKQLKVDGQRVLNLLCQDTKLNISPYYLRPGNPFGGACLPKDVRALVHHGHQVGVDLPLLRGVVESNQRQLESVLTALDRLGQREAVILGLSFKQGTDDLRESAMVEVAHALLCRGDRVRLYDPAVNLEALIGSNQRTLEAKLPQIESLWCRDLPTAIGQQGVLVVAHKCVPLAELAKVVTPRHVILDVNGWPELKSLPARYEGLCW